MWSTLFKRSLQTSRTSSHLAAVFGAGRVAGFTTRTTVTTPTTDTTTTTAPVTTEAQAPLPLTQIAEKKSSYVPADPKGFNKAFPDGTIPITVDKIANMGFIRRRLDDLSDYIDDHLNTIRFGGSVAAAGLVTYGAWRLLDGIVTTLDRLGALHETVVSASFTAGALTALVGAASVRAAMEFQEMAGDPSERVIQEIMENVRNDPRLELTLGGRVLPGYFALVGTTQGGPRFLNTKEWLLKRWLAHDTAYAQEHQELPLFHRLDGYSSFAKPVEYYTKEAKLARELRAKEQEAEAKANAAAPVEAAASQPVEHTGDSTPIPTASSASQSREQTEAQAQSQAQSQAQPPILSTLPPGPTLGRNKKEMTEAERAESESAYIAVLQSIGGTTVLLNDEQKAELRRDAELARQKDEQERIKKYREGTDEERKQAMENLQQRRKDKLGFSGWQRFWKPRRLQLIMHGLVQETRANVLLVVELEKHQTGPGFKGSGGFTRYTTFQVFTMNRYDSDQCDIAEGELPFQCITLDGPETPVVLSQTRLSHLFDTLQFKVAKAEAKARAKVKVPQ